MKEMSSQSSTTQTIDGWIPDTRSIVSVFGARLPVMDMIVIPRLSYHRAFLKGQDVLVKEIGFFNKDFFLPASRHSF